MAIIMKRLPFRAILIVLSLLVLCWLPVVFEFYPPLVAGFLTIGTLTAGWVAEKILGGNANQKKD